MSDIKITSQYGNVRDHVNAESGMTPEQMDRARAGLDSFESRLVSRHGPMPGASSIEQRESILRPELDRMGANLLPNRVANHRKTANYGGMPSGLNFGTGTGASLGGQAGQYAQTPRPYQPEFDSPDRLSYPVHRILANRYWRLFHKLDPHVGTAIDILSELWVSDFQLSGVGIEGSIKRDLESMVEETQLLGMQPYMAREYFVTGEALPHLIFDDSKGYFVHLALHNPDQVEVIDAPFLDMDPVMEFVPDDRLRQIVMSADPSLIEVRNSIPDELIARIQSGQNVPLDPVNTTFLARKLHPYDSRGTSLLSRLWRIFMYDDAIFSASIAIARRASNPLKVVKMGNERTGWIPGPAAEAKMADLIARAEQDPNAWIVTHYGNAFEMWGDPQRGLNITRELDTIERLKLIGLGVSKSLVYGEVTFATAQTGLQVLMHRMKTFRHMMDSKWTIPKYFRQVAKINGWTKISKSESRRNYRIKRSADELSDGDYITPTLEYANSLSPRSDADMQKAIEGLERIGIKISKTTKMATVAGLSLDRERQKIAEEEAQEKAYLTRHQETEGKPVVPTPAPPEGSGAAVPVPAPPGAAEGATGATGSAVPTPAPPAASATTAAVPTPLPGVPEKAASWDYEEHIRPIAEFLLGNPDPAIDSDFWRDYHKKNAELTDAHSKWEAADEFLVEAGFLDPEIDALHTALVRMKALHDPAKEALDALPEDAGAMPDHEFDAKVAALSESGLKKKSAEENLPPDNFFTGLTERPRGPKFKFVGASTKTISKWSKLQSHMGRHSHGPKKLSAPHGRFDYNIDAMPWDSPVNQESRNNWQKRLDTSKLPDVVKSRVRYLENAGTDHWNTGFDRVWGAIAKRLKTRMRLEPESIRELLAVEIAGHVDSFHNTPGYYDALADIYAEGKLESYKALNFADVKRRRLKTASTSKIAVTVDSVTEREVLDRLADNALSKVTSTVSGDLKQRILDSLTESGTYSESITDLANRLIKEERGKLESDPTLSHKDLQDRLRELYETQRYNIQRIMRTEAINAYCIATLRGFKEQGIEKVKWNAHLGQTALDPSVTCNVCRGLDGLEFEIDYLLSLGAYPISALSHIQCRCWLSPVIMFVSFDEFEKEYEKTNPTEFVPTQTVVNEDLAELSETLKRIKTKLTEFQGVPPEYADAVQETMAATVEKASPEYAALMPTQVQIVPDIATTDMFKQEVGEETAQDLVQQVTNYTDSNGVGYVSGFATRDENPSVLVLRTWAENVWDRDEPTRVRFMKLYDELRAREEPESVSSGTIDKLVSTLEPWAPARRVQMGAVEAVTLNKKFRELGDSAALDFLRSVGISAKDAARLVNWRKEYVLWDAGSGGVIESASHPEKSPFVNDVAALDPEHLFVESLITYSTSPQELRSRSPEIHDVLQSVYFSGASE